MRTNSQLVEFLEQELSLPQDAIALSVRKAGDMPNLLPIALWKYGFVTAKQLNQIFDWLEAL